jgi:hypothetical protein
MKYIDVSTPKYPNTFALVDDCDFDSVSGYKWYAKKKHKVFYAAMNYSSETPSGRIDLHRFIMNPKSGQEVDHRNGDGLDNRRSNLRVCSHRQNLMNQRIRKGASSKYKGVVWDKTNKKWKASIGFNYKLIHLGRYINEKDAAMAYDKKAQELFGEFARINFPNYIQIGSGTSKTRNDNVTVITPAVVVKTTD